MPACPHCRKNKPATQLRPRADRPHLQPVCDDCYRRKGSNTRRAAADKQEPAPMETPPVAIASSNLVLMQNRRRVRDALDDAYPVIGKGYRDAFVNDKSIAATLGLAESFIAQIREANYGPARVEDVAELRREGRALMEMMASLETDTLARLEDLSHRVKALVVRIDALG